MSRRALSPRSVGVTSGALRRSLTVVFLFMGVLLNSAQGRASKAPCQQMGSRQSDGQFARACASLRLVVTSLMPVRMWRGLSSVPKRLRGITRLRYPGFPPQANASEGVRHVHCDESV